MKLKADRIKRPSVPNQSTFSKVISCNHDSLGTEHNPRTLVRTVRCKTCGYIVLQMTEKEFLDGFWDKELVALQPGIARGRGGDSDE